MRGILATSHLNGSCTEACVHSGLDARQQRLRGTKSREGLVMLRYVLVASVLLVSIGAWGDTLFDNTNGNAVFNNPRVSTVVQFIGRVHIDDINDYHWNSGQGAAPGTIALRDSQGRMYGPFAARRQNANWIATLNVDLPAGTYTVVDSGQSTWSNNAGSGNRGFSIIRGHMVTSSGPASGSSRSGPGPNPGPGPTPLPGTPVLGSTVGSRPRPMPASTGGSAPRTSASKPSPCTLRNGFQFECYGTVIAVSPNPVILGRAVTFSVNPASGYSFDGNTVIVLERSGGVGLGVGLLTLCGGLRGGARNTPCPIPGATSKTMTLNIPNDGSLPAGTYLLRAENWDNPVVVGGAGFCNPACTEADAGYVKFGLTSGPPPKPTPLPAPFITNLSIMNHLPSHEQCVSSQPTTVTVDVQGQNFDPNGAEIVVSHIYFVDRHGTFRTDYQGRDSRVGANMTQRSAGFLQGTVDLVAIHQKAGDPFGLGGNYYVQVQNGDGQVNPRASFYFTVLPYQGGDSHCR